MNRPTLINLTSHPVRVRRDDGTDVEIAPSGQLARVEYNEHKQTIAGGIAIKVNEVQRTTGLPPKRWGVLLIVSTRVRIANPDRTDLLSPTKFNRDGSRNIMSCRALERNPQPNKQNRRVYRD